MYNTEGPEIMRLYNEKDNSNHVDFTSVLDSVYSNVPNKISSGSVQSITTQSSSVLFSTLSSPSGRLPILMKKARFRQDSEENTR